MKVVRTLLPKYTTHPHLYTVYAAFLVNDKYNVYLSHPKFDKDDKDFENDKVQLTHMRIRRVDKLPITNFQLLQDIKNEILGENVTAIQIFPAKADYVNNANTYHLFTWNEIDVPNLKDFYFYLKP